MMKYVIPAILSVEWWLGHQGLIKPRSLVALLIAILTCVYLFSIMVLTQTLENLNKKKEQK
jgi:hypothetical protein